MATPMAPVVTTTEGPEIPVACCFDIAVPFQALQGELPLSCQFQATQPVLSRGEMPNV